MKEQTIVAKTNRREMLRLSGAGVLGAVAAGGPASSTVQAADPNITVAYASWIHGHSMQIEYPDRIASERRAGFSINVEGKPGTSNWFHFAIPTPVIVNDERLRIDAVLLRFRTGSVDAFVRDVHVYDGEKLIAAHDKVNLSKDNWFVKLVVPDRPEVLWGLGISLGAGFGVEMMNHSMEFFAAGCDFTLQAPVPV